MAEQHRQAAALFLQAAASVNTMRVTLELNNTVLTSATLTDADGCPLFAQEDIAETAKFLGKVHLS